MCLAVPVSYTHLDVYKRQSIDSPDFDAIAEHFIDTFLANHADLFTPYDVLNTHHNHPLEQPIDSDDIKDSDI